MMVNSQPSLPCSLRYRNTSSGTAIWKPSSTIMAKKPRVHAAASSVLRRATSGGSSCVSLKSAAAAPSCLPKITQSASARARQKSGMPMTSGKSFAFQGHSSALNVPQAESAMMAIASASEVRLCMALPRAPGLEYREQDHADRHDEQRDHHRPAEPGRVVARHRDVRSEEHTSELQSHSDLVCRLLLEKKTTTGYDRVSTSSRQTHVQSMRQRRLSY